MRLNKLTYVRSGVNIKKANKFVNFISSLSKKTNKSGDFKNIGGFGAISKVPNNLKNPHIVTSTDGVGTKIEIANELKKFDTIGIDLVAMCVNDLIVCGAEPLFFLDYFATGGLNVATAKSVVSGIGAGCELAGCALIGGETAEMPGMYAPGDYDLAGFCVGAVERNQVLSSAAVRANDVILGLASDGVHSNGFSLVRHVIEHAGATYGDAAPFADGQTFGEVLLTPTRMYVKSCLAAVKTGGVHALAHITGGGLMENLPRVLPNGLGADIDSTAWTPPAVFQWLAATGEINDDEMLRTFNCGIGMVLVCAADHVKMVTRALNDAGETVIQIGRIRPRSGDAAITIRTPEALWQS